MIMPPNTVVPTEWRPSWPAPWASINGTTPRMNANEVIRIGRNRILRGFDRSLDQRKPAFPQLFGEFHDQNRVLARQSDQHHQTDLAVDIVLQTAQRLCAERSEQRHGHGEQHDEGQHEAFILRRERQVHDQNSQAEQNDCGPARSQFFERRDLSIRT